jgi:hypothetical protein
MDLIWWKMLGILFLYFLHCVKFPDFWELSRKNFNQTAISNLIINKQIIANVSSFSN